MKKTISALIVGVLLSSSAYSSNFNFRVNVKEKLSTWNYISTMHSPWMNEGELHSCLKWSPDAETMPHGEAFQQVRDCKQTQYRTATKRQQDSFSGLIKTIPESKQYRDLITQVEQSAIGIARNWIDHDAVHTEWTNTGNEYNHNDWTPAISDQTESYIASRDYSQNQIRYRQDRVIDTYTGDIKDSGEPVKEMQTISSSESATVNISFSPWRYYGEESNCETWLPDFSGQIKDFSQSTSCDREQEREREYSIENGKLGSKRETRSHVITHSRNITSKLAGWSEKGESYDCTEWDEDASNYYIEESIDRTRSCKQDEETEVEYMVENNIVHSDVITRNIDKVVEETVFGLKHHTLELRSCGFVSENPGCEGEWGVTVDNTKYNADRSYLMVVINPLNKRVVSAKNYDIYGYKTSNRTGPDEFNSDFDAVPSGHIIAIATYDEPNSNSVEIASRINSLGASMFGNLTSNLKESGQGYSGSDDYRTAYYIAGYKNGPKITENWGPRYGGGIRSGVIELD